MSGSWFEVVTISRRFVTGLYPYIVILFHQLISLSRREEVEEKTYKPAPSRALYTRRGGVERSHEGVVGAPLLDDELLERAVVQHAASALALRGGRREVLPEEGVVDVA